MTKWKWVISIYAVYLGVLWVLLGPPKKKRKRHRRRLKISFIFDGKETEMGFLKVTQKAPVVLKVTDSKGNPGLLDGKPVWSLSNPDLADLVLSDDALSASLNPKGPVGSLTVQVHGDGDLSEGVRDILGELQVDLIPGDSVKIALELGAATDQ